MSSLTHEFFRNVCLEVSFFLLASVFLEGTFSGHSKHYCIDGCISVVACKDFLHLRILQLQHIESLILFLFILLCFHNVILI